MDIMTTAVSTAIASVTVIVTSIFGTLPAESTTPTNTVTVTTATVESFEKQVEQKMKEPVIVCGSGGLVPANAPKCPKK